MAHALRFGAPKNQGRVSLTALPDRMRALLGAAHVLATFGMAALPLIALGCAHEPAGEERYAPLDAMIETQARDLLMPGVSAAMMERGRLVWTGARGWADFGKRIPVTPRRRSTSHRSPSR